MIRLSLMRIFVCTVLIRIQRIAFLGLMSSHVCFVQKAWMIWLFIFCRTIIIWMENVLSVVLVAQFMNAQSSKSFMFMGLILTLRKLHRPSDLLNRRISVRWMYGRAFRWYDGIVKSYDAAEDLFLILYDDGRNINLISARSGI